MNPGEVLPAVGTEREVVSLIQVLHDSATRLEELTGGEVDSVADREGRTFLLRHAQEYMRDNENRKQLAILNALPAHVAMLDASGVIVSVNEAWRRFAAANALQGPQDAIGVNYLDICDQACGESAAEAHPVADGIRAVLDGTCAGYEVEYPCHSPDEQRWYQLTVTPLEAGHRHGVVVMHLNTTSAKRAKRSLRRFAAAMDTIADAILLVDRSTMKFVHVNDAACRYMGLRREELLAMAPWEAVGTSRAKLERAYDRIIAQAAGANPLEVRLERPDGSFVWAEIRRHAQQADGHTTIVTLVRDISLRRMQEEKLRISTQRLDAIVTSAMDAILTVDGEYRIVLANPAALLMFGYTGAELEGQSLDVLVPARFRAAHPEHIAGFGRSGVTSRRMGELRPVSGLRKDGEEFPIEASISTDASSGHKLFTAILRDVTERLRAEETVHDLNVSLERRVAVRTLELESANRELEEFGRTIAHDLRAPVRAIAGFSGALRLALAGTLDPVAENYLGRVEKAAARMDAMVTDMLAFARSARAPVARAIIDMNGLVKAVLDELAGGQANGPEVACADLPPVSGDASLLRQVWTNLLSNAIKFSSKAVHPRIEIGANQNEYRVEFFVHDNGAGFDSQYRDKLFGVFQRLHTESEFPGNGVGLAIVKRIVERHGGHVSAQSTRGEGATFGFSLPRK
jgi:PAS domain S-box-containing protein